MQIAPFEMERWQSVWENKVELNIAESGVLPVSIGELVDDAGTLGRVLATPLGYPQTNGSEELRSRIAALYPGAKAENVLVTCGCAEANFLVAWSRLEPGDDFIFMLPNYMQIGGLARAFGAAVKPLWLREELGWAPDLDELFHLASDKTRLIAVCNPNNPTGTVLSEEAMERICAAAAKSGAYLLADEVYRGAEFDGGLSPTFWGRYERVICTGGLSKAYALPGLRIGWIVGSAQLVDELWAYHDYTSISPTMPGDRLAALALEPMRRQWILERTRRILHGNYPIVAEWVKRHAEVLRHVPPRAGAIAWVGCPKNWNTAQLAEDARARKGVLIVPGEQLGKGSHLRIGFGYHANTLQQALGRLEEVLMKVAGG